MTLSVLLIESDAAHASASAEAMADERTGWRIEVAHSADQARALLGRYAFDVIVVSHRLVDGTAFDLVALLAGKAVILSLAPGEESVMAQALRQGFHHHLMKDAGLAYLPTLALRVEMALRDTERARQGQPGAGRFEFALDGAGLGLWERHLVTGQMFVNERWRAILGFTPDGVVVDADVWQRLVHPQDMPRVIAASQTYINEQAPVYECEYRMRHQQGHWIWVLSRGRLMECDANGKALRLLGTLLDITQSRQTREAAERQHRLLQAISRAQSLFISTIDAKTVFDGVLADLLDITGSSYGFVGEVLFDAAQQPCLSIQTTANLAGDDASRRLDQMLAEGVTYPPQSQTLLTVALALGEPVIANDPAADPRWGEGAQARGAMNAFMGIPIHNDGELVAMVGLANRPEGYSQADVDLLDPLCNTIGQLVQARRSDAERRRVQTELEKTGELLLAKTRALRTTLDSIAQGINTVEADGRTTVYNRRYLELLELPESLMAQQPTLQEVVQFQRARGDFGQANEWVDPKGQAYMGRSGGMASPERYSRKTRAGRTLEIESRLLPSGGMVRTFTDVTDYIEAQEALKKSENRFRSLTELSSDWYWEQDEQFRFLRVEGGEGEAVSALFPDHVGLTRWQLGIEGVSQEAWRAHHQALQSHQTFRDFEFQRQGPDGVLHFIAVSGAPFFDAKGVFLGYRGVGRDITERKLAQQELEKARALLEQKAQALEIALDSMPQGLSKQEADGRITLYNRRFLELLDLPESVLNQQPTITDLIRFQAERGDFGENFELLDPVGLGYLQDQSFLNADAAPESYLRKTRTGRMLEVKSKLLPGGGMVRTFTDMTDFFHAQAALGDSEARFRSLTQLSSDWYWEQDVNFRFVRIEGSMESRVGMENVATVGMARWELPTYNVTEAQWEAHRQQLRAHQVFRDFEMERPSPPGEPQWVSISGTPIFDESGEFKGYRGVGRNITERKRAERKIERLAFYDELTGLPNRRLLTDRLQKALAASARNRSRGALLFIDLDNFKDLNDTQGHDVGDLLLKQVASRLRQCVREVDTVARLGGDEFIVMLDELSQSETQAAAQAEQVGRKILEALNQHFELLGQHHHSTPSIGITLFHDQLQSVDELLKRADLAMYQSKAAGRNTLRFFDPQMQASASARAALETDLRQGLQREELLLYYQPVVDAQSRITGVEALVRWQHPQRGLVSPLEFIPLAEQTGLIFPLGEWVLKTACEQLVTWSQQPATRDLSMAVNVSARQFRQNEFVEQVQQLLLHTGANPFRLKLELTESLLLSDVEDAIDKMSQLRAIGVSFSLDDFGTGYSSLSYLKRLPLDQLKIDQSFVRDVLSDPNDAAIVRTILALARSMELTVVAEGVETQGQREFLASNGCLMFQGYLFGRPAPIGALEGMTLAPVAQLPV